MVLMKRGGGGGEGGGEVDPYGEERVCGSTLL